MQKTHRWRDFNGPGQPLREEQMEAILAKYGILPLVDDQGRHYYAMAQFQEAWEALGKPDTKERLAAIQKKYAGSTSYAKKE